MRKAGHPHDGTRGFGVRIGAGAAFASVDVLRAIRLHSIQASFALAAAHGAQQDTCIFPEGPGEDGVEERVSARVDGVEEHQEDLRVGHSDERDFEGRGNGEKRDGRHAEEIGED